MNENVSAYDRMVIASRMVGIALLLSFFVFSIAFTLVMLTPITWSFVVGAMVGVIIVALNSEL